MYNLFLGQFSSEVRINVVEKSPQETYKLLSKQLKANKSNPPNKPPRRRVKMAVLQGRQAESHTGTG